MDADNAAADAPAHDSFYRMYDGEAEEAEEEEEGSSVASEGSEPSVPEDEDSSEDEDVPARKGRSRKATGPRGARAHLRAESAAYARDINGLSTQLDTMMALVATAAAANGVATSAGAGAGAASAGSASPRGDDIDVAARIRALVPLEEPCLADDDANNALLMQLASDGLLRVLEDGDECLRGVDLTLLATPEGARVPIGKLFAAWLQRGEFNNDDSATRFDAFVPPPYMNLVAAPEEGDRIVVTFRTATPVFLPGSWLSPEGSGSGSGSGSGGADKAPLLKKQMCPAGASDEEAEPYFVPSGVPAYVGSPGSVLAPAFPPGDSEEGDIVLPGGRLNLTFAAHGDDASLKRVLARLAHERPDIVTRHVTPGSGADVVLVRMPTILAVQHDSEKLYGIFKQHWEAAIKDAQNRGRAVPLTVAARNAARNAACGALLTEERVAGRDGGVRDSMSKITGLVSDVEATFAYMTAKQKAAVKARADKAAAVAAAAHAAHMAKLTAKSTAAGAGAGAGGGRGARSKRA